MKDRYVYPAIFAFADDGISIQFPDLPGCLTCGHSLEEALYNAREAASLHLYGMERDGDEIPEPTRVVARALGEGEVVVLIDIWMPPVRHEINWRSVKKTLTIPMWLNELAEKANVNFSQLLQAAIKQYLGIREQ